MDPFKTALDTVLTCWDRTAEYRKYIGSLRDNLKGLEGKKNELVRLHAEMDRLVEMAIGEKWTLNEVAAGWLDRAESLEKEADEIVAQGNWILDKRCLCGICCLNCRPRYKHSKLAEAKTAEIEAELIKGREFRVKDDVAYETAEVALGRSLKTLQEKMPELRDVFETVKQRVKEEEADPRRVRTHEVGGWLKRVQHFLDKEVPDLVKESQSQRNPVEYHDISKRANEKIAFLKEKSVEGRAFIKYTYEPEEPLILEIPDDRPVGAKSVFEEVWGWVEDETVRCIGLYGMGGVGKTNLLNRVNNQFAQISHDYDFVHMVVVSRPVNLENIQKAILEKLGVKTDNSASTNNVALIHRFIKEKNFLLFLDDLWEPIDLVKDIGIPHIGHPKKCKIIFTTREEEVCNAMQPNKRKKVECLPPEEAIQLFRHKLGEETWNAHPCIPEIATTLVDECKYLPLAIVITARVMAGITELNDWMDVAKDFSSRASKFHGMEEILAKLEISYDRLPHETHKKCFLYLAVFPEDEDIVEDDLIRLWMGEGFLDGYRNDLEERRRGEEIIRRLRHASLVELVSDTLGGRVYQMHDTIRDTALWIYSKEQRFNSKRIMVEKELESFRPKVLHKWKDAERISLWGVKGEFRNPLATVSCSHLSTMIMRYSNLGGLPDDFFLSMPCLRVLDLWGNKHCGRMPNSIWNLTKLWYLNLGMIDEGEQTLEVPAEIKNLSELRVLVLPPNVRYPMEALSSLTSLRVFHGSQEIRYFSFLLESRYEEIEELEMLQKMQSLEEISLALTSRRGVEKLMGCHWVLCLLRKLTLFGNIYFDPFIIPSSTLRSLEQLESLYFHRILVTKVDIVGEFAKPSPPKTSTLTRPASFNRLKELYIVDCNDLYDVTSLIYHAPILETLQISYCYALEEVIVGDIDDSHGNDHRLFQCLKYLFLDWLPSLESICKRTLLFPALKEIKVGDCSNLKRLPFNCDSGKNNLQVIEGERGWWDALEWDDPAAEQVFSPKFRRVASPFATSN